MKKIISILLVLILMLALAGCGSAKNTDKNAESKPNLKDIKCNVYTISGPTGIGMASLMDASKNGKAGLDYNFNIVGSNDEIVAKIANGEADIAAVATNLASTLYNKTNSNVTVLAINTLGVLNLVAKGENVTAVSDLKGKTIYSTGQGANPEYIITYILEKNGLTVGKDVELKFVSQPSELVTQVAQNEKAIVIAPQPVATTITVKDAAAKIVLNINDEWDKVTDTQLVMGCVIARNDFIKENPQAVKEFLKEYKNSINAVNSDLDTAAALCEEYTLAPSAAIAKKAIPYCNIVFQEGNTMKKNLSAYLEFLFKKSPSSIGGSLPKDGFYYEAD